MSDETTKGASNSECATDDSDNRIIALIRSRRRRYYNPDERLLAAARDDNEDLLLEVFKQGDFDINCQDGCVLSFFHPSIRSPTS